MSRYGPIVHTNARVVRSPRVRAVAWGRTPGGAAPLGGSSSVRARVRPRAAG